MTATIKPWFPKGLPAILGLAARSPEGVNRLALWTGAQPGRLCICVFTFGTARTLRPEYRYWSAIHKNCRVRDNCPPGAGIWW